MALKFRPGSKVLDVDAGTAPFRRYFAHCEYQTQDFKQLSCLQLQDQEQCAQIDFVGDISNISVLNASFDAILCTEVLEHVSEPIKAIKEFARIIRPGGVLFLTAPLGSGIHQSPFHFYGGFTPFWYERFLTDNGFTSIHVSPNRKCARFFGQETLRQLLFVGSQLLKPRCWFFLPILLPVFLLLLGPALLYPLFALALDRLDEQQSFTVGYFISAKRR